MPSCTCIIIFHYIVLRIIYVEFLSQQLSAFFKHSILNSLKRSILLICNLTSRVTHSPLIITFEILTNLKSKGSTYPLFLSSIYGEVRFFYINRTLFLSLHHRQKLWSWDILEGGYNLHITYNWDKLSPYIKKKASISTLLSV